MYATVGEECAVFTARVCHPVLVALAIELRLTILRPNITSPYSVASLFIVCVKKLGRQIFFGRDKNDISSVWIRFSRSATHMNEKLPQDSVAALRQGRLAGAPKWDSFQTGI